MSYKIELREIEELSGQDERKRLVSWKWSALLHRGRPTLDHRTWNSLPLPTGHCPLSFPQCAVRQISLSTRQAVTLHHKLAHSHTRFSGPATKLSNWTLQRGILGRCGNTAWWPSPSCWAQSSPTGSHPRLSQKRDRFQEERRMWAIWEFWEGLSETSTTVDQMILYHPIGSTLVSRSVGWHWSHDIIR